MTLNEFDPTQASSGHLLTNILLFGRLLRALGMDVNPGRMIDLVQALAHIEIGSKADFYFAARSLLVHRREDLPLFEKAFALFWRAPSTRSLLLDLPLTSRRQPKPSLQPPPLRDRETRDLKSPPPSKEDSDPPLVEVTLTYSDREVLRKRDFAELTADELAAIRQMMAGLLWQLGMRRTRRLKPGYGATLDLRRTLRGSLRFGGEVLLWATRQPKFKPRPLVIVADISGSMERYTRLLLHFIYSLAEGLSQGVEAFVFSTRLTRVTRQLRGRAVEPALAEVSRQVPDWSGGTRIGEALKTFNYQWARRVLGRGAVVLLISDGWDRGDVDLLRREMARLQRSCYRLIWLNPLLGSPEYEPLTRGMQAALPFIDEFLPVHNLASLEDLADQLLRLDDRRPIRRQWLNLSAG